MTDEERQRAMDFIVEQSGKNAVGIEQLLESQRKAELRLERNELRLDRDEYRLDRDERILKLMIKAGRRARQHMREQDRLFQEQRAHVDEKFATLAEAQTRTEASIAHTDKRLDALIDIVREGRNGRS